MKNLHLSLSLLLSLFLSLSLSAQNDNVGIGTSTPDSSAALDISADDKGMLVPRLTSAQRTGVHNPATGLLVFDTDTGSFWYYNGAAWQDLSAGLQDADGDTRIAVEQSPDEDAIRFTTDGTESMALTREGDLQIKGSDTDDPGFMELFNGDTTQFMRIFSGHSGDPEPFLNWQSGFPLRFFTSTYEFGNFQERMRIDGNGNIGIGTNSPQALLHASGGALLIEGETGETPASGTGTRLMWVPEKAAFRAGFVEGTQWDADNIGTQSFVGGGAFNTASGFSAFVGGGSSNTASGERAFVGGGGSNTADTVYAFVGGGTANTASGASAFVGGGVYNTASGFGAFVGGGDDNTASGSAAFVGGGVISTASGVSAFVGGGIGNIASGRSAFVGGGSGNTAPSRSETVFGQFSTNYTPANPNNPLDFNSNDRLFVIGNGTSTGNRSNAVTVLKNGNVGIGTDNPSAELEIFTDTTSYGGNGGLEITRADNDRWNINTFSSSDRDLGFFYNGSFKGYLDENTNVFAIDFTAQHRSLPAQGTVQDFQDKVGMIVSSSGDIYNLDGSKTPNVSESIPTVKLSEKAYDKSIYGVIAGAEELDPEGTISLRKYTHGIFGTAIERADEHDYRLIINSGGEGGVWVSNYNGKVENGDLIVTSPIPGIGMRQDDDLIHSFTVAKVVMDCDFDLNSDRYECREVVHDGKVYRMAFLACVYKCN